MTKPKVTEWRTIPCSDCCGAGMVPAYSRDDFEGGEECDYCNGSGQLYVSPTDRLFVYPGGPARGSRNGAYANGKDVRYDA